MRRYSNQARGDNPPHIFAVADAAYHAVLHQRVNQAIVISGESGAGKTESANLLLKQLVFLGKVNKYFAFYLFLNFRIHLLDPRLNGLF